MKSLSLKREKAIIIVLMNATAWWNRCYCWWNSSGSRQRWILLIVFSTFANKIILIRRPSRYSFESVNDIAKKKIQFSAFNWDSSMHTTQRFLRWCWRTIFNWQRWHAIHWLVHVYRQRILTQPCRFAPLEYFLFDLFLTSRFNITL